MTSLEKFNGILELKKKRAAILQLAVLHSQDNESDASFDQYRDAEKVRIILKTKGRYGREKKSVYGNTVIELYRPSVVKEEDNTLEFSTKYAYDTPYTCLSQMELSTKTIKKYEFYRAEVVIRKDSVLIRWLLKGLMFEEDIIPMSEISIIKVEYLDYLNEWGDHKE